MGSGIRVQIHVDAPDCCPVATISSTESETISMISWSQSNGDDSVVEEFTASGEGAPNRPAGVSIVFDSCEQTRYRFTRSENDCICSRIEQEGFPIETIRAEPAGLSISFFVDDLEDLEGLVSELRDTFGGIRLQSLCQTDELRDHIPIWIDRAKLTPRQEEVLRTAFEMGYFDYPKKANGIEVAENLGIGISTFSEHLSVAQTKLIEELFSE